MSAEKVVKLPVRTPKKFPYTSSDEEWLVPPSIPQKRLLPAPRVDQSVWPGQCYPGFWPRQSDAGPVMAECWFCRYADFHLDREKPLDVGICCYPKREMIDAYP